MEEKRPSFVESSDSDIRKLFSNVVSTKYEPESRKCQVFWVFRIQIRGTARVHFTSFNLKKKPVR